MKILSKSISKQFASEIKRSLFFAFSSHGYKFDDHVLAIFTPSNLIISCLQNLKIPHKNLRTKLSSVFKTTEISQMKMEFTYELIGFEFEGHKFLVWFNATGKGTTVETNCTDPGIHHRFCLSVLHKLNYKMDKEDLGFLPARYHGHLNDDKSLKSDYFNEYLVSHEEFKKSPHFRF